MFQRILIAVGSFLAGVFTLALMQVSNDRRKNEAVIDKVGSYLGDPEDELDVEFAMVRGFDPDVMNAILLTEANVDLIMSTKPEIERASLFAVLDEYGDAAFIFVPFWKDLNEEDFGDWAIVPVRTMQEHVEILQGVSWAEAGARFVPVEPKPSSSDIAVDTLDEPPLELPHT